MGIISNVALATQFDLHSHFILRCCCLISFSVPRRIDHAPLLMSPLIFTSAQSCCYAQVFFFLGGGWVLGGWRGIVSNVALATQLDLHLHFMLRC